MKPLFNFDGIAMLSIFAFLATALLLVGTLIAAAVLRLRNRPVAASRALRVAGALAAGYAVILFGVSLASRPREVAPGQEKYFCEIDCHMAYSVTEVRRTPELAGLRANGVWQVVKLRMRFDPETTSERRDDSPLTPNPRKVWLMDADGHRHNAADVGTGVLSRADGPSNALTTPLRPGESSTTVLVFDVPAELGPTRLVFTEADPVTRVLIGHENSLLHARTTFALTATGERASR
jgi:hypothetical protein